MNIRKGYTWHYIPFHWINIVYFDKKTQILLRSISSAYISQDLKIQMKQLLTTVDGLAIHTDKIYIVALANNLLATVII